MSVEIKDFDRFDVKGRFDRDQFRKFIYSRLKMIDFRKESREY